MKDDPRCCGSGTCIIDPEGRCWCGQQWEGRVTDKLPIEAENTGDAQRAVSESDKSKSNK
jgi:hypothetical protein